MSTRVLSIFGTRPEAIKMAPVVHALASDGRFDSRVLLTGQHLQMLDDVVHLFGMEIWRDLKVMRERQTLAYLTATLVTELSEAVREVRPDMVLVHGDTTTTLMGALAAVYEKVPVAHVEAGLRSHQKYSPFPEEINRRLADQISDICFAPTAEAGSNLLREGVDAGRIHVVGNTIVDAVNMALPLIQPPSVLRDVPADRPVVVVTAHRRENWDTGIAVFSNAVVQLSDTYPDFLFIFPVHLNPAVREVVFGVASGRSNVMLTDPLPYFDFLYLLKRAVAVMSDSGGIQEECVTLHKPMLLLRKVTERPEAVASGWVTLVGDDLDHIVSSFAALAQCGFRGTANAAANPYGNGTAAQQILESIDNYLCAQEAEDSTP